MVNNRMMVGKIVDAPVKKNAFLYQVRIIVIVAPFDIIANKIPDADFIRVSGKMCMC
jgi:hypothetical protein